MARQGPEGGAFGFSSESRGLIIRKGRRLLQAPVRVAKGARTGDLVPFGSQLAAALVVDTKLVPGRIKGQERYGKDDPTFDIKAGTEGLVVFHRTESITPPGSYPKSPTRRERSVAFPTTEGAHPWASDIGPNQSGENLTPEDGYREFGQYFAWAMGAIADIMILMEGRIPKEYV